MAAFSILEDLRDREINEKKKYQKSELTAIMVKTFKRMRNNRYTK